MKRKIAATTCIIIAVCLLITGCIPKPGADTASVAAAGKYENGTYSNTYFGVTISIKEGWKTTENDQMVQDAKTRILAAPVSDDTRQQMQLSLDNTVYMIFANKYPAEFIGTNPSITIAAEKLPYSANFVIKTGEDYLKSLQSHALGIETDIKFGKIERETVGKREFYSIEASIQNQGMVQYRRYYAILDKGYALVIGTLWQTDEEKKELEQMVASMAFS